MKPSRSKFLATALISLILLGTAGPDPALAGNADYANMLGASYTPQQTTFRIWSPDHSGVRLVLGDETHDMAKADDVNGYTDVYEVSMPGDHRLKPYHFEVNGHSVRDPYGRMVEPSTNNNIVMDLDRVEWKGRWSARPTLAKREDAIIYEVHVRDLTMDPNSGVPENLRGRFMGLVHRGGTYRGVPTGLDHIVDLGVTHVQILPFYDFGSCPDVNDRACYNWGYDPVNYNVPEERYSLTPYDYENRMAELKETIDQLHKAGLRVIMDVVYNHTHSKEMFDPITSRYYTSTDLSGTGNSIDANVPMVSRMIRDSLEYWVREYNIDGFRFDLIGIFDYDEVGRWATYLNETFPDRNLLIYGEPWNGYASDSREAQRVRLGTIARIQVSHVGVFNSKFREAIKGSNDDGGCGDNQCYAMAYPQADLGQIEIGSRGAPRAANDPCIEIQTWDPMFATDPEQVVNYVSAHDNLTLRDKILKWRDSYRNDAGDEYLRRIQKFANGIVLTSQGISFLHAGVEMLRDKQGEHNSYASSDEINMIRWEWAVQNRDVIDYYKDMIALRKAHPGLRFNNWDEINENISSYRFNDQGVLRTHIRSSANGDPWSEIVVIYNMKGNQSVQLPDTGSWKVAVEKADPEAGNGRTVSGGSVMADGTAVTVLYRD